MAFGDTVTCALFESGGVRCWGNTHYNGLARADSISWVGYQPGDMSSIPFISFSTTHEVTQISCGLDDWMSCALFNNGKIRCWGHRTSSTIVSNLDFLSFSDTILAISVSSGYYINCAVFENFRIRCKKCHILAHES